MSRVRKPQRRRPSPTQIKIDALELTHELSFTIGDVLADLGPVEKFVISLGAAANDLTLGNRLLMWRSKDPAGMLAREPRGPEALYLLRIQAAHLYEALEAIVAVVHEPAVRALVERTDDGAPEIVDGLVAFKASPAGEWLASVRHLAFHYPAQHDGKKTSIATREALVGRRGERGVIRFGDAQGAFRAEYADELMLDVVARGVETEPRLLGRRLGELVAVAGDVIALAQLVQHQYFAVEHAGAVTFTTDPD